ncbi:hypothetical protein JGS22_021255 [Streptomyces sp. P38-E01]|uniref:Nucleotidyltransferase domain-containing protein n=1 Tax=Streptomyces tardus TaxID=2780544 RepID=A0A949JHG6_9ACTN|nr:hypothetical protein [Streptomyces tardus]MBU7600092.1 hypothetical protein [Streptomyces tardus]
MTGSAALRSPAAEEALATVGLTTGEVTALLDRERADGPRHLVGSLASGFGNAHSDVDVHILVDGLEEPVGPRLRHVGETAVDVELFPARWPAQEVARLSEVPVAELPFGRIALEPAVRSSQRRWLCRWVHAAPLGAGTGPVFTEEEVRVLLPAIVRQAFDRALTEAAVALLADRAARDGADGWTAQACGYLWNRAARGVLEVHCRAAGEVTTGEKWLPARARRLGLTLPDPGAPADGGAALLALLDLTPSDVLEAVRVRPAEGLRRAELAGRSFLANRHDRLFAEWLETEGPLAGVLEEHSPGRLLDAFRRAQLDLTADPDALSGRSQP